MKAQFHCNFKNHPKQNGCGTKWEGEFGANNQCPKCGAIYFTWANYKEFQETQAAEYKTTGEKL